MSSRPLIKPFPVISNGNMASTIISKVTIIDNISMVGYGVSWAGTTPVGVVTVQVSNDYSENVDGSVRNAGTWNTLTLSAATNVSGNTGNGFIDIDAISANAIRLVYTPASGTGLFQAIINCKVA